jgi:hypothetical protein
MSATFIGVIVGGSGSGGTIAVSTRQFAALNALLKKVEPLGEMETSASAVSPAAFAIVGIAKANANMNNAIAELKSLTATSC